MQELERTASELHTARNLNVIIVCRLLRITAKSLAGSGIHEGNFRDFLVNRNERNVPWPRNYILGGDADYSTKENGKGFVGFRQWRNQPWHRWFHRPSQHWFDI